MEVTLRPVADSDADREFLFQLFVSTSGKVLASLSQAERTQLLRMQFKGQCHQHHQDYPAATREIILVDGCPAGRLTLDRGPVRLHLIELSLLPEYRLRGIGGRVLAELIRESERGELPLSLQVDVDNPVSSYYHRLGFVEQEQRGFYRCLQRRSEKAAYRGFGE